MEPMGRGDTLGASGATVWPAQSHRQGILHCPRHLRARSVGRECGLKERLYTFVGEDFRYGAARQLKASFFSN